MSDVIEYRGEKYILGETVVAADDMLPSGFKPWLNGTTSRYSWTCSICGTTEAIEVLRIQPFCDECARRLKKMLYGEENNGN